MKQLLRTIILLLLSGITNCFAEHGKSVSSIVVANDFSGYEEVVVYSGIALLEDETCFIRFDKELEQVENIQVTYTDVKGKTRKLRAADIVLTMIETSNFYTAFAAYKFTIPAYSPYKYSYTRKSRELMLLSDMLSGYGGEGDSVSVTIHVPKGGNFLYSKTDLDSTTALDSLVKGDAIEYHFSRLIRNVRKDKRVRAIVVPGGNDPWIYFNNWYSGLLADRSSCGPEITAQVDQLVPAGEMNPDSIINVLFSFVRSKIKYIDVENGLGAFQPRKPDFVFEKRQGDCKDMANLLCRMLKHKGVEAYVALSSTKHHRCDLDFPSLASANHAICVVRKDSQWIYLDATDPCSSYDVEPDHIEGRYVFVIGYNNGMQVKVNRTTAERNSINITQILTQNEQGGYNAKLSITCTGNAANHFRCYKYYRSEYDFNQWLLKFFETTGTVGNMSGAFTPSGFSAEANLSLPAGIIDSVGALRLFDFNLLLPVFSTATFIAGNEPSFSITATCNTVVQLSNPVRSLSRYAECKEKGYTLTFSIKTPKANQLELKETLIIDTGLLEKKETLKILSAKTNKTINNVLHQ